MIKGLDAFAGALNRVCEAWICFDHLYARDDYHGGAESDERYCADCVNEYDDMED